MTNKELLELYKNYILNEYDDDYSNCNDVDVLRSLKKGEEYVKSIYRSCSSSLFNCGCNSLCYPDFVYESIFLFTYDYLNNNFGDDKTSYQSAETIAYYHLLNSGGVIVN